MEEGQCTRDVSMMGSDYSEQEDESPLVVHADSTEIHHHSINTTVTVEDAKLPAGSDDDSIEEVEQSCQRYFLEKSGPKCFNCGQPGHMSKDCTAARNLPCFLCGRLGHQRFSCPEELCHNCMRPGHMSRDCKQPRKRRLNFHDLCRRCNRPGHQASDCQVRWRQYVFAKRLDRVKGLLELKRICYNCAGLDHFGDECPYERKRYDWTIFHEPDMEYLKLTEVTLNERKREEPRDNRRHDTCRKQAPSNPSPNWRKLQSHKRSDVVTEANYYDHFDGSYKGNGSQGSGAGRSSSNNNNSASQKSRPHHEKGTRSSAGPSHHKSRGGYGHSSSSNNDRR